MPQNTPIKVALADDHILLRNALAALINQFGDCTVVTEASSGEELLNSIRSGPVPDVLLLDLNMPGMDGYETAARLREEYPDIRILMLTMYDTELVLIRLLQAGVKGFLKKDIHPSDLKQAIHTVMTAGYYYSQSTSGKLANLFRKEKDQGMALEKALLSEKEIAFLKLACTELTYKEIAQELGLNPRSVDNLRDTLFTRLDVKSRVGLAMYAIKQGLISL